MDGSGAYWYFSMMGKRAKTHAAAVRSVDFHATKYGRPLLVDAAFVADMPAFDRSRRPYRLTFYDILLVTKGRGSFALDDARHEVAPGVALFTRPGEVRQWAVKSLDGACLFFAPDFVREAFSDPRFVEHFAFFRPGRPSGALRLTSRQRVEFLKRFTTMRAEFARVGVDTSHLLRARLYELLVLLNRWYTRAHGAGRPRPDSITARFTALVDRDFRKEHRVAAYAAGLGVTPGHLTLLCKTALGLTAGAVIHQRLAAEAKRLLLFTETPVADIGFALGFDDPAYFSRFFRRLAGVSPRRYRSAGLKA